MAPANNNVTYADACHALMAFLPGFPFMLDEAAQGDESWALNLCAEQTDSASDWEVVDIDQGCNEFAAEWEHARRP